MEIITNIFNGLVYAAGTLTAVVGTVRILDCFFLLIIDSIFKKH